MHCVDSELLNSREPTRTVVKVSFHRLWFPCGIYDLSGGKQSQEIALHYPAVRVSISIHFEDSDFSVCRLKDPQYCSYLHRI